MRPLEPAHERKTVFEPAVPLIRPRIFGPGIRAAMSTRAGGISPPPFESLNLGFGTADRPEHVAENLRRLADAFGVATQALRSVRQVHGRALAEAEKLPAANGGGALIEADALIAQTPGLACLVNVADCAPVLVAADDASAVAAIHAGWRGTAAGIVAATFAALTRLRPRARWRAWIGPCISRSAFEVGEEVAQALRRAGAAPEDLGEPYEREGRVRYRVDLKAVLVRQLLACGLERTAIEVDPACTYHDAERFFSHRRACECDGGQAGRMAALIMIEPTAVNRP